MSIEFRKKVKWIFYSMGFMCVFFRFLIAQETDYPPGWAELHDSRGWTFLKKTGKIVVFSKKINVSPVPAILLEMETEAIPADLLEGVWRVEHYSKTLPSAFIINSGVIKRYENNQIAWQIIDAPLVDKRFYIFNHFRFNNRIEWIPTSAEIPDIELGEILKPRINFGSWNIEEKDGKTILIYRACTDPEGVIPPWLVTMAQTKNIPKMMVELEKAVRE